ncbi:transcriptional regulator ERG homolog [Montipora capricornis]|uniref:transcriptional regulator ERG homolog n=1 Tax=Montipora capricornis TaxID=246305 RepID=UPI0035F14F87
MVVSTIAHERDVVERLPNTEEQKEIFIHSQKQKLSTESDAREPRYKNIVHLWEFLLELLAEESCRSLITWVRKERGEFKLKNAEEVAKRWGLVKRKKGMNYEKLGRALRYYYQQGIIKKVPGQRLVYKFNKLPYDYKPGVTRSLHHASLISASIHIEKENSVSPKTPVTPTTVVTPPPHQTTNDTTPQAAVLIPTPTTMGRSWSWPVIPIPRCPMCSCPASTPLLSTAGSLRSGSRIMYPIFDSFSSQSTPCFKPVKLISPLSASF